MNDTATDELAEPGEHEEARARVRAWQILVLVAGVLLFSGAIVFLLTTSSDRDEAVASHRRAAAALQRERLALWDAKRQVDTLRTAGGLNASAADFALTSMRDLQNIEDQIVAESQTLQSLGADPSAPDAEINAAIQQSGVLMQQYNAKVADINNFLQGAKPNGA